MSGRWPARRDRESRTGLEGQQAKDRMGPERAKAGARPGRRGKRDLQDLARALGLGEATKKPDGKKVRARSWANDRDCC